MNRELLIEVLKQSEQLEETASWFYLKLSRKYTEHNDFWLEFYIEEKKHAAIYRAFIDEEIPLTLFPEEIVDTDLDRLRKNKSDIQHALDHFDEKFINREKAYCFALEIEQLAGEKIFNEAMDKESDSEALQLIQKINKDDKDHIARITSLMNSQKKVIIKRRKLQD